MTRIPVSLAFGALWLGVGGLSVLFLAWARKELHGEPPAPVYPMEMWRHRRDVTILRPPYDQDKDRGGDAA